MQIVRWNASIFFPHLPPLHRVLNTYATTWPLYFVDDDYINYLAYFTFILSFTVAHRTLFLSQKGHCIQIHVAPLYSNHFLKAGNDTYYTQLKTSGYVGKPQHKTTLFLKEELWFLLRLPQLEECDLYYVNRDTFLISQGQWDIFTGTDQRHSFLHTPFIYL